MPVLRIVAQNVQDLFYQNFKSEEDFFTKEHFRYLVAIGYAVFLQQEWEKSYQMSRAEGETPAATLNDQWFIKEEIDIKRAEQISPFEAILKNPIFQFNFDKSNSGMKDIIPLNGKCKDFIKIGFDERYKMRLLPPSPEIYWYPLGNKIHFERMFCGLSKAIAIYIPALDCNNPDAPIADALAGPVTGATLNLMFQAKQGQPIVDTTSDGNPNKEMLTEINNIIKKYSSK